MKSHYMGIVARTAQKEKYEEKNIVYDFRFGTRHDGNHSSFINYHMIILAAIHFNADAKMISIQRRRYPSETHLDTSLNNYEKVKPEFTVNKMKELPLN